MKYPNWIKQLEGSKFYETAIALHERALKDEAYYTKLNYAADSTLVEAFYWKEADEGFNYWEEANIYVVNTLKKQSLKENILDFMEYLNSNYFFDGVVWLENDTEILYSIEKIIEKWIKQE